MNKLEKIAVAGLLALAPALSGCASKYAEMGPETCGFPLSNERYLLIKQREEENKKRISRDRIYINSEKSTQN